MHAHEDAQQQLGLHRQPAVSLVSLAGFAAGPHMTTSWHQASRQHRQQRNGTAVVHFSTTTAAVTDLNRGSSSDGGNMGQAAASSQQPGSSGRHPEQPAGATAAGANAWWDADGCFEYRAPLSTTVRRLKVGLSRLAAWWGNLGNAAFCAALWSPVRVAGVSMFQAGSHTVQGPRLLSRDRLHNALTTVGVHVSVHPCTDLLIGCLGQRRRS